MKRILLVAFLISTFSFSYGSHLMGGNIVADQLIDSTYIVTLTVYRDTLGIPFGSFNSFDVYDDNDVWLFDYTQDYDTTLSGYLLPGYPYGVEVYVVTDTVTFPGPGEYRVTWSTCCRNAVIANMTSPGGESMFLETVVTVYGSAANSTPSFLIQPVIYLPVNTPWSYNPLPFDVNGDSLHWSLDTPLSTGSGGALSQNVVGYTLPPADPTGPFTLNPLTGEISWTANTLGNFNATVLVEEFRNGQKIGLIRRDMQLIVIPDTNQLAKITNFDDMPMDAHGNISFNLPIYSEFVLTILASDPNPQDNVYLEAYGGPFLVGTNTATFVTQSTGNGNEIEGTFRWAPTLEHKDFANTFTVVFRVKDDQFVSDESVLLKVDWTVGIEEPTFSGIGNIYPNPVQSSLFIPISLEQPSDLKITIYDILGSKVSDLPVKKYQSGLQAIAAYLGDIGDGQYFARIEQDGKIISTQKFVVLQNK